MRWKERLFLNATTGQQVTIAGFYYLCFNRATGNIDGTPPPLPPNHLRVGLIAC